jgi:hypothetical protein
MNRFVTKWTSWEYFPAWLANIPVYGIFAWFALRARHLVFFSNINPKIPLSGALGESKRDIFKLIPAEVLPNMIYVKAGADFETVVQQLDVAGLKYPLIAKPDVGERGFLVKKIAGADDLRGHLSDYPVDFVIQEFLALPREMSVMFHLDPSDGRFDITSVCLKEFLSVTGDGRSTVAQLMALDARAAFQLARFAAESPGLLKEIPAAGEQRLLEPIGNHIRGTKFLNGNALIDDRLRAAFEPVCRRIDGVQFGRFDLKYESLESLYRGEYKVMEMNGVFSEPAHIYDPEHGALRAYCDYYRLWRLMYRLSRAQTARGIRPTPVLEAAGMFRDYFRYKKQLEPG